MPIEEIKNIKCGKVELRKFGVTIGIVLGLLGGLFFWREKDYYSYFLILSSVFLFFGLALPVALKLIYKIWMTLAVLIGWFMTRVILSVLFYLVFTSFRLLAAISGKHFLDLKLDKSKKSYWIHKKSKEFKKSEYERQF